MGVVWKALQTAWSFVVQNWLWFAIGAGVLVALIIVLCAVGAAKKHKRVNYAPKANATSARAAEPVAEPLQEQPEQVKAVEPKKPEQESKVKKECMPEPVVEETAQESAPEADEPEQEAVAAQEPVQQADTQAEPVEEQEAPAQEPEAEQEARTAYSGKWEIRHVGEKEYVAYLCASNGEVIFRSESYTTANGARNGIETIRKNVGLEKFDVHRDKRGQFYFKVKSSFGRLLGTSATYATESSVMRAMESVKRFSARAVLADDIVEDMSVTEYQPTTPWNPGATAYRGKWRIVEENGLYYAQLFASNGELMLCSESAASEETAFAKLNNIRKNVYEQRFVIKVDKKGKYTFTLRNNQKTALCVSESYDSYVACANAIESVVRFCATAPAPEE